MPSSTSIQMRARIILAVALLAGALATGGWWVQTRLTPPVAGWEGDGLIRVHFLANSDSPADQELKLAVRDAVIGAFGPEFSAARTREEAESLIRLRWGDIQEVAHRTVRAAGYSYPVRLELGRFSFPAVDTGLIALPAGEYQALRVIIGAGRGHNFWCVLFPPLCFGAKDGGIRLVVGKKALPTARTGANGGAGVVEAAPSPRKDQIAGPAFAPQPTPAERPLRIEWRLLSLDLALDRNKGR